MTIREIEQRLLGLLNEKVRRGEISQRQLARLTGFTQPHIHNVLKGARAMNTKLADAALECLNLSVKDLLAGSGPASCEGAPLWEGEVGLGSPFPRPPREAVSLFFPSWFLSRYDRPVLLRVGEAENSMAPLIEPSDLILMDQSEARRGKPDFGSIYVISLAGSGRLCRCQRAGNCLLVTAENNRCSSLPDQVPLANGNMLDLVKGVVVWVCREFNRP